MAKDFFLGGIGLIALRLVDVLLDALVEGLNS